MASHGDLSVLQVIAELSADDGSADAEALAHALGLGGPDFWAELFPLLEPLQGEGLLDIDAGPASSRYRLTLSPEGHLALTPRNSA